MTEAAWRTMAQHMGVENMGGPAVGFGPDLPTPTVTYGAVMTHDRATGVMTGFTYGGAVGGEHAGHAMPAADSAVHRAAREHEGHLMRQPPLGQPGDSLAVAETVRRFHAALAAGDSATVLSLLAEDAVVLESGRVETREQYRSGHLRGDIAFAREVPSTRGPVAVTVSGDVAWASATSSTVGERPGRAINAVGAELMVLSRDGASWKIRAIHWSSATRRPPG
jgi:ketosteroid isomerase-like protein